MPSENVFPPASAAASRRNAARRARRDRRARYSARRRSRQYFSAISASRFSRSIAWRSHARAHDVITARYGRKSAAVFCDAITSTGLFLSRAAMSTSPTSAPGPCTAVRLRSPDGRRLSARTPPERITAHALTASPVSQSVSPRAYRRSAAPRHAVSAKTSSGAICANSGQRRSAAFSVSVVCLTPLCCRSNLQFGYTILYCL